MLGEPEVGQERVLGAVACATRMLAGLTSRWTSPCAVRLVERAGDLRDERDGRAAGSSRPLAREQRAQVGALDEAHRHVEQPVLLAGVEDLRRRAGGRSPPPAGTRARSARGTPGPAAIAGAISFSATGGRARDRSRGRPRPCRRAPPTRVHAVPGERRPHLSCDPIAPAFDRVRAPSASSRPGSSAPATSACTQMEPGRSTGSLCCARCDPGGRDVRRCPHASRSPDRRPQRLSRPRRHLPGHAGERAARPRDAPRPRPADRKSVEAKPDGLLLHENLLFSLFPPHAGMRQYWRDFESLERWTRSEPHREWWQRFLRDSAAPASGTRPTSCAAASRPSTTMSSARSGSRASLPRYRPAARCLGAPHAQPATRPEPPAPVLAEAELYGAE